MNGRPAAAGRRTDKVPGPAGFTLIEVLVVVAILALLIAILLPSLAKAREQTRTAVCASQLKEYGSGTLMYRMDAKESLPGPIHAALELETFGVSVSADYEQWHLNWFIRKYFSDRRSSGRYTDKVSSCPTAVRLSKSDPTGARPFTYALNNWNKNRPRDDGIGTNPPWYFGYPDYFWNNAPPPFTPISSPNPQLSKDAHPKRLGSIRQLGREWAIADAFTYRQDLPLAPGKTHGQWRRGTYSNVDWADRVGLPDKPYHSDGINVLCFDGHVEWQRPWRGTVNRAP
jgi:prepilin-type N-terminal cleavage/methylation domain-containing protein/prepilin-type processing-associated H-X9-DG protein